MRPKDALVLLTDGRTLSEDDSIVRGYSSWAPPTKRTSAGSRPHTWLAIRELRLRLNLFGR
jgi:hypothetical protein